MRYERIPSVTSPALCITPVGLLQDTYSEKLLIGADSRYVPGSNLVPIMTGAFYSLENLLFRQLLSSPRISRASYIVRLSISNV